MTKLAGIITNAARGNMAEFTSMLESELRSRIRRHIVRQKPNIFTENARGGEARFRFDHGFAMHPHPVATEDNFKSDHTQASRIADHVTVGDEERTDPYGVPAKLKDLAMRGTGVSATSTDDTMSMSAKEYIDFVDDEELHTEAVQSVYRRQIADMDHNEYERRIARRELRETVERIAPTYERKTGNRLSSPIIAEVVRHYLNQLEGMM